MEASYPATAPMNCGTANLRQSSLTAAIGASVLTLGANPAGTSNFGDAVVLTATLGPSAPEGLTTNGRNNHLPEREHHPGDGRADRRCGYPEPDLAAHRDRQSNGRLSR